MPVNKYKPTSPGIRFQTHHTFDEITKARPEKALTKGKPKTGGRNSAGRITSRFIGGGHKQKYRVIDFRRADKDGPYQRADDRADAADPQLPSGAIGAQ